MIFKFYVEYVFGKMKVCNLNIAINRVKQKMLQWAINKNQYKSLWITIYIFYFIIQIRPPPQTKLQYDPRTSEAVKFFVRDVIGINQQQHCYILLNCRFNKP
jgi:hypothetical protein